MTASITPFTNRTNSGWPLAMPAPYGSRENVSLDTSNSVGSFLRNCRRMTSSVETASTWPLRNSCTHCA